MTRKLPAILSVALALASAPAFGSPAFADEIRDLQWHLKFLKVTEAQRISTGKGITVAVLDTGVSKHRDLAGSVLAGTDFVGNGGSGQVDNDGHGTAMATLISAHGKRGNGLLGIAPEAKILPVRVVSSEAKDKDIARGIDFAVAHGAKVINMSLGGPGVTPEVIRSVNAAVKADVVLVAGAGNRPEDNKVIAPAVLPQVMAVGAISESGTLSKVSVTGPEVDVVAPGEHIAAGDKNDTYSKSRTGTSDATAIVSGAAALLRSKYPDMTAKEVVERLESTAVDKGAPGVDDEYGHGVLNIVAALNAGGSGGTQPSATAPTPQSSDRPSAQPSGVAAEPSSGSSSGSSAMLFGGIVLIVLVGGIGLFFGLRSRRRSGSV
jgi:type VII secretion-associated serine protease mycosin